MILGVLTGGRGSGSWGNKSCNATWCWDKVYTLLVVILSTKSGESPPPRIKAYLVAAKELESQLWLPVSPGAEETGGPKVWSWHRAWCGPSKTGLESCLVESQGTGPLQLPEVVWSDKGEGAEWRGLSASCRLILSPGLGVGRKDLVPESPLSPLPSFFSSRQPGRFPFPCHNPGAGYSRASLLSGLWLPGRRGEVTACVLRGVFWGLVEMTSRLPCPLLSGGAQSPPGLAGLRLVSSVISLRGFACSDVWSGCSKGRWSGMGRRHETKQEGGAHEGGLSLILPGCNSPLRVGAEQESWLSYSHDFQLSAKGTWTPSTSRRFRLLETRTRGKWGNRHQKQQKARGWECGLDGAGTLSIPVVSSVHKTPLHVFLLRHMSRIFPCGEQSRKHSSLCINWIWEDWTKHNQLIVLTRTEVASGMAAPRCLNDTSGALTVS